MDAELLRREWSRARADVRTRWDKLTVGDVAAIDGDLDYLEDALQARYAWQPERARLETARWLATLAREDGGGDFASEARAALAPAAEMLREALGLLGAGIVRLARVLAGNARERVAESTAPARAAVEEKARALREHGGDAIARAERFVRERPLASLGIALLAGYLLFRRRE